MKKYLGILALVIVAAATGVYFYQKSSDEISYRTVKVERGNIVATVAATGSLSAVKTVLVGSQVSGTIQRLHVDYNSTVKKGEAIAEIDPSLFNAAVDQAQGNFLNAEANLQRSKIQLADAERSFSRSRKLYEDGIISQVDLDTAETALNSARASVKGAEGGVAQARGALMLAKTNLRFSVIRSPVNGVIISKSVDVGQTVAASFQTPTLFTIAQDLTKMQIEVSVDEADISRIVLNQKGAFTVDSYAGQTFNGRVVQIRSAPVVTQNVVTYVVVINVDNSDLKLLPGMTANVSIEVAKKESVLKLPPAALRFKPKGKDNADKKSASAKETGQRPEGGGTPKAGSGKGKERVLQVYILKDGNPVAVPVKTGIANSSSIELLEGLSEGDEVIVEQLGGESARRKPASPMGPRF